MVRCHKRQSKRFDEQIIMDADITIEIIQTEDLKDSISEMLDAIKEQLIHLAEIIQDKTKKGLLIIMLTFTLSPVQAMPISMDSLEDCTEIVVANVAGKYYDKLEKLSTLEDDWDGEGAKAVNKQAIENVRHLIEMLPQSVLLADFRLFPSELGAVSIKLKTDKGAVRSEIGDSVFSYYVRRNDTKKTEHHSFEDWSESNISMFVSSLSNLV